MSSPLVTIVYTGLRGDEEIEEVRHWYHVPRVGEMVWVGRLIGQVYTVSWNDDGTVDVILK